MFSPHNSLYFPPSQFPFFSPHNSQCSPPNSRRFPLKIPFILPLTIPVFFPSPFPVFPSQFPVFFPSQFPVSPSRSPAFPPLKLQFLSLPIPSSPSRFPPFPACPPLPPQAPPGAFPAHSYCLSPHIPGFPRCFPGVLAMFSLTIPGRSGSPQSPARTRRPHPWLRGHAPSTSSFTPLVKLPVNHSRSLF